MEIVSKSKCSGCHACFNICPKDAITMVSDENGFKYPQIDENLCVHCNLCKKVCPVLKDIKKENDIHAYACINKNDEVRKNSSSGGVFYLLAENILSKNGVVFGARFNDDFDVVHDYIEKIEDISLFQGSKYVQSTIHDSFKKAKKFLDSNRLVLFTGTPCQIEGLLSYLQKDYPNLITQDFICHGVPSPKVFTFYKENIECKYNDKIKNIYFRSKPHGWKDFYMSIDFENNHYESSHDDDVYMKAFLNDISLRESCYQCNAKKKHRLSDITLADFWGIENVLPELDDDKGTSLVIINSISGKQLFEEIKNQIIYREVEYEKAIAHNPSLYQSVNRPKNRDTYLNSVTANNLNNVTKKYTKVSIFKKVIHKINRIIGD